MTGCSVNNELKRTTEETTVAWSDVLFSHFTGRTEQNYVKCVSVNNSLG
jgi:hypothetical protein